jgi:hypothetical protein
MKLFKKILALFHTPAPEPTAPLPYADEEFLSVVMEQARKRIRAEQTARQAAIQPPASPDPLSAAA